MENSSAYSGIITPRSRRLRTIGLVLLIVIGIMVLYGYFGLMPSISTGARELAANHITVSGAPVNGNPANPGPVLSRAERVRKLQVTAALAYWGVCSLLVLAVLLIAWLDLREISRRYVEERRAMWLQAASRNNSSEDSS